MAKNGDFVDAHHYGISRDPKQHALALRHGLAMMPDNFVCMLCSFCEGEGKRKFEMCPLCSGTGLLQYPCFPATDSQRNQVLVAASGSLLLDFEVSVI